MRINRHFFDFFLIFLIGIVFVLPIILVPNLKPYPISDYDSNLPVYDFLVDFVNTHRRFPSWNPYVGTGIPVIADPLSAVLNPLFTIPILVFDVDLGIKIVFFFVFLASGLSMWWFLGSLNIEKNIRLLGALLYQVSGALVAQIASGHIEKFLSYPLIPLFLLFALKERMRFIECLAEGLIFTLIVFSGDFYNFYFLSIFFILIRLYYFLTVKKVFIFKEIFLTFVIFSLISSIKMVPFLFRLYPNLERFFPIDPFTGSIHIIFGILPFITPFQAEFYDRPFFQRVLGFHFNWHEYYTFISPLPFIFLVKFKQIFKNEKARILLIIFVVGLLYAALKYPYSPFYWLFHLVPFVRNFRVPQRIFMPLTAVVISILLICGDHWLKNAKKKWVKALVLGILILSIIWSFYLSRQTLIRTFMPVNKENQLLIAALREKDGSNFYVVVFYPGLQRFLIEEKIPILNYYYGWRPKKAPNFLSEDGESYNYPLLETVRPKYAITKASQDLSLYSYVPFMRNNQVAIWKTDKITIIPQLKYEL